MIRHWVCLSLALSAISLAAHAGIREELLESLDAQIARADGKDAKAPLKELRAHIAGLENLETVWGASAVEGSGTAAPLGASPLAQVMTPQTESGRLQIKPEGASACPGSSVFFAGQSVRLSGSGFGSGEAVEVSFGEGDSDAAPLASTSADSSGNLDAVVIIPSGVSTPTLGQLEARGLTGSGTTLVLSTLFQVSAPSAGDADSDSIPDICDNCPSVANSGQENGDLDTQGDACDPCPLDPDNDRDGDSLCADVDPCPFDPADDADGDGLCAEHDNCPNVANPLQGDQDANGIGDACQTADTCADGVDNDGDSFTDFPADSGCSDAADTTETDVSLPCDDGIDNDSDALSDYRPGGAGDPGCGADTSLAEDPECDDGIDNDGDLAVDWDGQFGLYQPDEDCAGIGSTVIELPEPGVVWGLAGGAALLVALRRRRGSAA